jgi:hypothetical protein
MSNVIAKVISQKGTCDAQHKLVMSLSSEKRLRLAFVHMLFTPFSLVPKSCDLAVHSPGSETQTKLLLPVLTQQTRWCLN